MLGNIFLGYGNLLENLRKLLESVWKSSGYRPHRDARRARVIFYEVSEIKAVYSNDLGNLTSLFGCDVQQERNWEFMIYMVR